MLTFLIIIVGDGEEKKRQNFPFFPSELTLILCMEWNALIMAFFAKMKNKNDDEWKNVQLFDSVRKKKKKMDLLMARRIPVLNHLQSLSISEYSIHIFMQNRMNRDNA